jgi:hypothetical protein
MKALIGWLGAAESSLKGLPPPRFVPRIVAEQRPVPALYRQFLLALVVEHVVAVGDARAVGDDQRWTGIGLGLVEYAQGLHILGAVGDGRHIDMAVVAGEPGEILLRGGLAAGGELGHRTERRGLRGLAAGVGIDLGIEHQDVDVVGQRQHVVEAAVADVVGPAVAADDPHRAADQPFGDAGEFVRARGWLDVASLSSSSGDAAALFDDAGLLALVGLNQRFGEITADFTAISFTSCFA